MELNTITICPVSANAALLPMLYDTFDFLKIKPTEELQEQCNTRLFTMLNYLKSVLLPHDTIPRNFSNCQDHWRKNSFLHDCITIITPKKFNMNITASTYNPYTNLSVPALSFIINFF